MTHHVLREKVARSGGPERWHQLVEGYRLEALAYSTHTAKVREGAKGDDGKPYQHHPSPALGMDPDVVACVRPDIFILDYDIVDYLPVAAGDMAGLAARKTHLLHDLMLLQEKALFACCSGPKLKLAGLLFNQALSKKEDERTSADSDAISEFTRIHEAIRNIQIFFAHQEVEIEDLNFDTVNAWVPKPFKGN